MLPRNTAITIFLLAITASVLNSNPCFGQADPPANRTLSGNADFGDQGRHIAGATSLGTITITSDDLGMDPAHAISVAENGFAFLPNNFLIRNGGSSLTFDSSNQSETFDVYYLGEGSYNGDFTLPGQNSYTNGSGETVTAFGGNWIWQAQFNRLNGEQQTFSNSDARFFSNVAGFSPFTLGPSMNQAEISRTFNRTTSNPSVPAKLQLLEIDNKLQWTRSENQSVTLERQNTLFEVGPVAEGATQPTLDLSGIGIKAQGTALRDRRIGSANALAKDGIVQSATVDLGRSVVGFAPSAFNQNDVVELITNGTDDTRTRLTLNSFNESLDGVTATLDNAAAFDGENSIAQVDVSANFTIDASQTGTFQKTINVGSFIDGEGVVGESAQNSLNIGYQYAVLENNSAVAEDITVFKLEGTDASGELVTNFSARQEFSTDTHTDIFVSRNAILNGSNLQTVNLSDGNGISGEGLTGEQVTATASYDINVKTVQGSDLAVSESGLVADDPIVFENKQAVDAAALQAQSIVTRVTESGSSRWTLDGLQGWDLDLAAGESRSLTPTFDESGIDNSEATLGRNYRKSVSFTFQDGIRNLHSFVEDETRLGSVSGRLDDFQIIGGRDTAFVATYLLERNDVVTGSSGTAIVEAGTSLLSEGINLTNDSENTSSQFSAATAFSIVDSTILQSQVEVDANFVSLDSIDSESVFAVTDTDSFYSDIVEVSGLDGILHVLEMSYDDSLGRSDLQWFSEELDLWVNASLGNSNIGPGIELDPGSSNSGFIFVDGSSEATSIADYLAENRFEGSYDQYLVSQSGSGPQLGAFGSANGLAWAVIDHNSAFALAGSASAVPEPSGLLILGGTVGFLVSRRRRLS